ncbi:MAG: hypothetical protein OEZ59_01505 [Deltaproteobacteria bacterium]|nr:hypothetical protein [Deltaproteobacteria bacterium]
MTHGDDKKPAGDPLWIFMHNATAKAPKEVAFDRADAIYHLYRKTNNPFLKRAIAPPAKKLDRSQEDLSNLFRFLKGHPHYQVAPVNTEEPFTRRKLSHPPPPPVLKPEYIRPENLTGNSQRLPWMIMMFFDNILTRLEEKPGSFARVVEDLLEQFSADGLKIKFYEAYHTFGSWKDLMTTLREIARYPAPETFDLFCSALFTYHALAYPQGRAASPDTTG